MHLLSLSTFQRFAFSIHRMQRKFLRHLKLVRDYGPVLKMLVKPEQYKFNTVKRILLTLNTSGHIIACTNGSHWMLAEQGQRYCGTTRIRGKRWSMDLEVVLPELEHTIHTLSHHRCWRPSHRVSSPSRILYFEMTIHLQRFLTYPRRKLSRTQSWIRKWSAPW